MDERLKKELETFVSGLYTHDRRAIDQARNHHGKAKSCKELRNGAFMGAGLKALAAIVTSYLDNRHYEKLKYGSIALLAASALAWAKQSYHEWYVQVPPGTRKRIEQKQNEINREREGKGLRPLGQSVQDLFLLSVKKSKHPAGRRLGGSSSGSRNR